MDASPLAKHRGSLADLQTLPCNALDTSGTTSDCKRFRLRRTLKAETTAQRRAIAVG